MALAFLILTLVIVCGSIVNTMLQLQFMKFLLAVIRESRQK